MKYNHAQAEKQFRREWRIKFRFYRENGMTLEQILPLYKMDKAELRNDRRYYEHTVPLEEIERDLQHAQMPELDTYNESNWLDAISIELAQQLSVLPAERLRAFYLHRVCGYTQAEIAVKFHKSQTAIFYWLAQIAEIIDSFKSNL